MRRIRVAVLMGGTSQEREVSLSTGNEVIKAIDKTGRYITAPYDPKTDLGKLFEDRKKTDVAFIAMHGAGGEDGTIQGLLDLISIPYIGSGVLASALGMDKSRSLHLFEQAGMRVPGFRVWKKHQANRELFGLQFPVIVKPNKHGSSLGISIVKNADQLKKAVDLAFGQDDEIMIQDYIQGTELTVGVIGNDKLEVLPIIEIIPMKSDFYDYASKYEPEGSKHIIPARIDAKTAGLAEVWAKNTHKVLGCRGFSRTDFMYGSPANKITSDLASHEKNLYVLEINTIPGLTPTSLFPDAAKAAGYDFSELIEKLIHLALEGK